MFKLNFKLVSALVAIMMSVSALAAQAKPEFSAITVDARNGAVLFSDQGDGKRHPASLTKMMTLYLLFQEMKAGRVTRDTQFKVSARAAAMPPTNLRLRAGSTITVDEAIRALVTKSANDVASTIAENLGGSESAFAARMTRVAHSIGMSNSSFYNASGLPDPLQYTTARDMATLGLRIMRDFPQYYPYFRITSFQFHGRTIKTHNTLVLKYPGTDGFKTGYVAHAGFNLATSTKRGEKRLVGVVLGAKSPASRAFYMREMLERNFVKAKDGDTVAALAGSSDGAVNPVGTTKAVGTAPKQVALNSLGLAAAAASADSERDANPTTGSSAPRVVIAELAPALETKKPDNLPFAVISANDKPSNLASGFSDSWNVQVGSFTEKSGAEDQLNTSRQKFAELLSGKTGFTVQADKDGTVVYRARFAGFSAANAAKACAAVKRSGATCLIISPES